MNHFRRFFFNLAGLTLVVQLAFAQAFAAPSFKGAYNPQGNEHERLRRVMDPATDIEEFRRELHDYLTEMEDAMRLFSEVAAVQKKFDQAGLQPLALLAETKQRLSELKPEELSLMRASYARFPNWREAPRSINSLIKPELRQMVEPRIAARPDSENIVIAGIADDCAAGLAADHTNTDISIAAAVVIAAEAVMEGFPTDGLTILARLVPVAAVATAKGALLAIETLKNIKDDCNGATFEADVQTQITNSTNTIVNNDNANMTTILNSLTTAKNEIVNNDNSNRTEIINNDNSNKTMLTTTISAAQTSITTAIGAAQTSINNNSNANTATLNTVISNSQTAIINNSNANTATLNTAISDARTAIINNDNANKNELRDLLLRTQIEADLAEVDGATPVAWYLTPTANGGHLDLVQTIVTQTLANIQAAGGSIGNAQPFLDQANADKAAGRFKDAYKNYRKAYKAAAN